LPFPIKCVPPGREKFADFSKGEILAFPEFLSQDCRGFFKTKKLNKGEKKNE
jgi:hypothetical protein